MSLSEDGLTYTLKIKDVKVSDTGDYTISIGDLTATVPLFIERTHKYFMTFTNIKNILCFVLFFPKGLCLPVLVELAEILPRKQTFPFRLSGDEQLLPFFPPPLRLEVLS